MTRYQEFKSWNEDQLLEKCINAGDQTAPDFKDASLMLEHRFLTNQLNYAKALNCFTALLVIASFLQAIAALALIALALKK